VKTLFSYALSIAAAFSLLSGCALRLDSAQGRLAQGDMVPARASSYQVLFRFDGNPNGQEPVVGLTDVDGTLYGTTYEGGIACNGHFHGCGAIYSITTSGAEKVLFSFEGLHGVNPLSPLIEINGTLYGTTEWGGSDHYGTFYSVTTSGSETVLHTFHLERSDGQNPIGSLLNLKGTLYGTTSRGGHIRGDPNCSGGCGTVYSITRSGTEKVLHRFRAGSDGFDPAAGLTDVKGTLYGTTLLGGGKCDYPYPSCGTVYRITPQGSYKQLYTFAGGTDGALPSSRLTNVDGTLYGTTQNGGSGCGGSGCGTVFTITTSGEEKVVYRFAGGSDGAHPYSRVIDVSGTLYGTTAFGGDTRKGAVDCCGTVFALSNAKTVPHSYVPPSFVVP
jgi:uncharacterized repeat protein (TIGR03803 family)